MKFMAQLAVKGVAFEDVIKRIEAFPDMVKRNAMRDIVLGMRRRVPNCNEVPVSVLRNRLNEVWTLTEPEIAHIVGSGLIEEKKDAFTKIPLLKTSDIEHVLWRIAGITNKRKMRAALKVIVDASLAGEVAQSVLTVKFRRLGVLSEAEIAHLVKG